MAHWLMKSEPDECSIDDLAAAPGQTLPWTGVRNYQARNFLRDAMAVGDDVLFYHSSCAQPGIVGLAQVAGTAYPDPTQFDAASPYHDPASPRERPRWLCIDVRFVARVQPLTLVMMRRHPGLADLQILQRGNRLSVTPVTPSQWERLAPLLART